MFCVIFEYDKVVVVFEIAVQVLPPFIVNSHPTTFPVFPLKFKVPIPEFPQKEPPPEIAPPTVGKKAVIQTFGFLMIFE